MKKCNKCLVNKPLSEFHKNKRNQDGYYQSCKICVNLNARNYIKKRMEQDPNYSHNRYKKEVDKNYEIYKAKRKLRTDRWIANNRDQYLLHKRKNQAKRKSKQSITIPISDINKLMQDSNNKCFWCDSDIEKGQMHLDHIYPLSKGGLHNINNLVVSCWLCNQKKHAKDPDVFMEEILREKIYG